MGLREQKRAHAEQALIAVALRLFRDLGYDDTTVEHIAAEAAVSPRTFYRYFLNKDGVLAGIGLRLVDRALDRPGDDDVRGLVTRLAVAYEELAETDNFREYSRLLRENEGLADRAPAWRARWGRYLAERLAESNGWEHPSMDDGVRAGTAILVISLAIDEWLYREPHTPLPDLAERALASLHAAIGAR